MRRSSRCLLAIACSLGPIFAIAGQDETNSLRFEDVVGTSGIDFVLNNCATPEKRMIETMAGGVAAFDYDGDGRPDIFFTNGAEVPSLSENGNKSYWNRLYHNDGGPEVSRCDCRRPVLPAKDTRWALPQPITTTTGIRICL